MVGVTLDGPAVPVAVAATRNRRSPPKARGRRKVVGTSLVGVAVDGPATVGGSTVMEGRTDVDSSGASVGVASQHSPATFVGYDTSERYAYRGGSDANGGPAVMGAPVGAMTTAAFDFNDMGGPAP